MRGRRPLPTEVKRLRGNPGKRRLNAHEPTPSSRRPTRPDFLTSRAAAKWDELVPELEAAHLLSRLDGELLAIFCQAWADWIEAELAVRGASPVIDTMLGNLVVSPWRTVANQHRKELLRLAVELGLSPSARSRIKVGPPEEADALLGFLRVAETG